MLKRKLWIVCMCLIVGLMSACSSNESSSKPVDLQGHEQVTLTYASWGSTNEKKVQQEIAKKFTEKYPWIKINYMHIPGDYVTKLTTMFAANQAPDVFPIYKAQALQWAEQGKLYNLNEFLKEDKELTKESLIPNSVIYWDKDKVAGIKVTEEAFALYYNKDLFDEAGIALPPVKAEEAWTWEQFLETAQKLTIDKAGNNALSPNFDASNIKQYGVRFDTWMWHLLVPSNNASVISDKGDSLNLESPDVIEAVQKMADLINVYHVAPSPTQSKNIPSPAVALQSKRVAMDLDGQWVQLDLGESKVNFGVGVLPKLKSSKTILFGEPEVISAKTKHPKEAWMFYKFLLDAESGLDMHSSGLWMPVMKKWYTEPDLISKWADVKPGHADGYRDAVMNQTLHNGVNSYDYYLKNSEKINAIINPALDQVWLGKKTVEQAFKEVSAKANAEFKGTYPKE
ncbi:ABC transporter substrate-binding protein [Paenibacillus peoriae]|uniref:ABC transporter substrate-binding protein n=1 Tax=Paenibacillus peoriae TaxID=59893 RepID=UPI0006A6EE0F|nr:sugar ABC transporter substrate-binding protein [Paenibacillus peoriae]ALA43783.1 ABC transporter substrate-binding protein [Paenibacillus peoriae]